MTDEGEREKKSRRLGTGKQATGNAGDRERECVGVWVCGEREGSNKVQGFKGKVGDRERVGFKEKC